MVSYDERFGSGPELFLFTRQHRLQICVIRFWFCAAGKIDVLRFARRSYADSLGHLRGVLFAIVIIGDLVFVAVDAETDLSQIKSSAKIMRVLKLRLRPSSTFRKLQLDLIRQAKAILQVAALAGQIL